jgi:tetratricopeptide (TPR) repeat protein
LKKIRKFKLFFLFLLCFITSTANAQNNNADQYFDLGLKELDAGQFENAIKHFDQAINIDPNTPEAYYNRGAARANIFAKKNPFERTQAMISGKSTLVKDAIGDFTKAISIDATNFQYYAARAAAYIFIRDTKSAIIDLDKAISMDPSQANLYFHRGLARILCADIKGGWADIGKSKKMGFSPTGAASEQLNKLRTIK